MTWYKAGTCSVTSGSPTVTGTGTAWVDNVRIGSDGFVGPDGLLYEILKVVSSTEITLAAAYKGTTASSGGYAIAPIQGYTKELADKAAALIDQFSDAEATAASSASAAASSASAASDSATAAASSASAASASETNAKNSETNAASSASAAASSASAASNSATAAASSASAASASETNAKNSETNAASSAAAAATSETKIAAAVTQAVTQAVAEAKLAAHPVGSYYWSSESTDPSTLFGGTWEQVKDRFVLAAGDSYAAGATGGTASSSHTHQYGMAIGDWWGCPTIYPGDSVKSTGALEGGTTATGWTNMGSGAAYRNNALSAGQSEDNTTALFKSTANTSAATVDNMPPYIVAFCWKRTA